MFALCVATALTAALTAAQTSQAQEPHQSDLCVGLSNLIEASKTGFASIQGEQIDEKDRSYFSEVELPGWPSGFVYPEHVAGPFVLYVSLGGDNRSEIKKRYNEWRSKLKACLPGWKLNESSSAEEVATLFRQDIEGPSIQLDYNVEPSKIGDTRFDLYLTFNVPSNVLEKNFCSELSTLIDASRSGFGSIVGVAHDELRGSYASKLILSGWDSGWVYPKADGPNVLYIILGSNKISEVKSKYDRWVTKVTTCLPEWKRTEVASREDVKSVFKAISDGPMVELEYNVKPSKVASTKYDLYLTVSAPRVTQKASP